MSIISFNSIKPYISAFFLVAVVSFSCLFSCCAYAQVPGTAHDSSYEEVFSPVMTSTSIIIDDDNDFAVEPNISNIKFYRYPVLTSLEERIDRLLHGIETYIRPEQDQYGHEIRRYMAHVGDMRIYNDSEFLLKQYRNVKKAKVIVEFWNKYLEKELIDIDNLINDEDSNASLSERSSFRQNKNIVRTFAMSLKLWVESNEHLLHKIGENQEIYHVRYPEIIVINPKNRIEIYNLISIRAAKLRDIQVYSPFALMA